MSSRPALIALAALAACGPKKVEPVAPPVGWHQEAEGWQFACYFPPDWEQLPSGERKVARSNALDEMLKQWTGGREDGVAFKEERAEEVETVLLGRPDKIEAIVATNNKHCVAASTGQAGMDAWESWLRAVPAQLTAGECMTPPLDYTMFDYLEIGAGWQRPLGICKDDKVRISGTLKDKYQVEDGGPWINVLGDPDKPTAGDDALPCNLEGCYFGMLVFRFVSDYGVEMIKPVEGGELIFTAPEHGTISYRINDEQFYDNKWYKSGGIVDHTAIEVSPAN
jgi:hypothetical protein